MIRVSPSMSNATTSVPLFLGMRFFAIGLFDERPALCGFKALLLSEQPSLAFYFINLLYKFVQPRQPNALFPNSVIFLICFGDQDIWYSSFDEFLFECIYFILVCNRFFVPGETARDFFCLSFVQPCIQHYMSSEDVVRFLLGMVKTETRLSFKESCSKVQFLS